MYVKIYSNIESKLKIIQTMSTKLTKEGVMGIALVHMDKLLENKCT